MPRSTAPTPPPPSTTRSSATPRSTFRGIRLPHPAGLFHHYGEINADTTGGTIEITPTGSFTNYGTVAVSNGENAQIENGFVFTTQPETVTNEAAGVIIGPARSSLTVGAGSFTNEGLLEATNGSVVDVANTSTTTAPLILPAAQLILRQVAAIPERSTDGADDVGSSTVR